MNVTNIKLDCLQGSSLFSEQSMFSDGSMGQSTFLIEKLSQRKFQSGLFIADFYISITLIFLKMPLVTGLAKN